MQKHAATESPAESRGRRGRGRPKLEVVAEIDSNLLEIALREFLKHGYGATSMTQIVRAARVSKTTLYSRFASKAELFRAIMEQQIDRIGGATTLHPQSGQLDLGAGLKAYANRMLELSLKGGLLEVNRLIYSESYRFPELGTAAAERTEVGIHQISDFIQECAAADKIPCRDPRSAAEVFILMLRGWYVNVMLTNRNIAKDVREQWVERAVNTLLAARRDW